MCETVECCAFHEKNIPLEVRRTVEFHGAGNDPEHVEWSGAVEKGVSVMVYVGYAYVQPTTPDTAVLDKLCCP